MDKKIEKIIYKCLLLIEKGYSLDECINKFEGRRDEITEYFKTIKNIKDLEVVMPEKDYRKNSLEQIIGEAKRRERISSEKAASVAAMKRNKPTAKKRLLLRPAMIFLVFLILTTFSFAGTLFASQETVPGQVLYPVKRSFEDFKLIVYPESKKDGLHFQFLNNRIDEANTLLESGDPDTGIFVEDLIEEIDKEYNMCRQYNCFSTRDEDGILNSINNIKNRYGYRYGKNGDNGTGNGREKDMGSDQNNSTGDNQEKDMGSGQENTNSMGQQNKNGGKNGK